VVNFPVVVGKQAKAYDFIGHPFEFRMGVRVREPDEE
jgi:hypothetical protein